MVVLALILFVGRVLVRGISRGRPTLEISRLLQTIPPAAPYRPSRAVPPPATLTWSPDEAFGLRKLALAGHYDSLESVLTRMRDQAAMDVRAETRYYDAYASFWDETTRPGLDAWVAARPASVPAHLARATQLVNLAWRRRGGATARATSRKQWQAMEATLDSVIAAVREALMRDPSALPGYWVLLRVAQTPGPTLEVLTPALQISPASFVTRLRAIMNMTPRWGGSYELMARLADDAQRFAAQDPELRTLQGFVDWDQADLAWRARDTAAANTHLRASLAFGESYFLCLEAASTMLAQGRLEEAERHAECVTRLRPSIAGGQLMLARTLYDRAGAISMTQWSDYNTRAREVAFLAFQLDPMDEEVGEFWDIASDPWGENKP